jgi:hypothetical protein
MKYGLIALSLMIMFGAGAYAFDPVTKTGNLGSSDAGAIMNYYTDPVVPDTYGFIDPKTVGLPKEDPKDVINVEKKDIFGKIIIDPETNVTTQE